MLHFQDPEHDEEQVDAGRLLSAAATLWRREGGEGRREVKGGERGGTGGEMEGRAQMERGGEGKRERRRKGRRGGGERYCSSYRHHS